jgi:hypothetical protein
LSFSLPLAQGQPQPRRYMSQSKAGADEFEQQLRTELLAPARTIGLLNFGQPVGSASSAAV